MTAPSHDIGFALALPALGLALGTERALGIAEAGQRPVVQDGREAVQEAGARLSHRRGPCSVERLGTVVPLKGFPALHGAGVTRNEHLQ